MKLFKHKNHRDIAYEILKEYWIPEKNLSKIKFRWWNVVERQYDMGLPSQKGTIAKEDYKNWKII